MNKEKFKSGFVGLFGRTNVGKSTLINKIINQKVVITSEKSQTTRSRTNCIYTTDNMQIIFVDCPGFFKPRRLLEKRLNSVIYKVLADVDIILVMVDIAGGIGTGDYYAFNSLRDRHQPKILLLNKIDLISKIQLNQQKKKLKDFDFFENVIPISAKTGENVEKLLKILTGKLPEGPQYFPDEMVTDQPVAQMIAEIVREKLFGNLSQEIPYGINVEVEKIKKSVNRSGEKIIKVDCNIYTERKSQKVIIIGKSGDMLKKIGKQARLELEDFLGCKVFLEMWVKVVKDWTKKESYLNKFGYLNY